MNDKELADKVVALGIGRWSADGDHIWLPCGNWVLECSEFVRDWRVAGALMGKVTYVEYKYLANGNNKIHANIPNVKGVKEAFNESLPRAIIEACVAALSEDGE